MTDVDSCVFWSRKHVHDQYGASEWCRVAKIEIPKETEK
jgi:hypothetical protein